ncbi:lymphocyte antigen 6B-like [Rhinatrema bivittatum]|uniref:lymphocyte antigen 6B-like n=1 Tax=Rhinatrema bivittatum TaxID=194408 RepID=UPI00112D6231|nr:lymphocyte antigen 6B-like [Rhinatrema bivittatum]
MKALLVLVLSAWLCSDLGEGQTDTIDCYRCLFKIDSYCMFTSSSMASCIKADNYCGTIKILIGNYTAFTINNCIPQGECNRVTTGPSQMKFLTYNTTCCTTNLCNSGLGLKLSLLTGLGVLSLWPLA